MKWTTDKPTKPGWYWFRSTTETADRWVCCEVLGIGNNRSTFVYDIRGYMNGLDRAPADAQWAGPIEEPTP